MRIIQHVEICHHETKSRNHLLQRNIVLMHTNVFFDFFPCVLGFLNTDAAKVLRVSCAQVRFVGRDF